MNIKKVSLSGIKPTGVPHLGNYLGMIRPAIELQHEYQARYFIAEYHALTSTKDAEALRDSTRKVAAYFLAFGLDPDRATLFRQSDLPQVTELAWLLSCVTNMGSLQRAHSYKAAIDKGIENEINHGVFGYPVLMAADILIQSADVVPVGKDQLQHLEMARSMAKSFNAAFVGDLLKLPEPLVQDDVAVIPGTDGRKMSKSYDNTIMPLSSPKELRAQIMTIETDSTPLADPKDPDTCNVFALYQLFASEEEVAEMRENYEGGGYGHGHAKIALYEKMNEYFDPYRDRYNELIEDPSYVEDVLAESAVRVQQLASVTMERIRNAAGLG